MENVLAKGAEAEIFLSGDIIKSRISKGYRLKALDESLRKSRNSREAKILQKMPEGVGAPKLISKEDYVLKMEYIQGQKVRDMLENDLSVCEQIGKKIALMHNAGIIHGDLTTSNMIFDGKNVRFIDFGLGFFSLKDEDKAVDLHLLRQALESRHYKVWERALKRILQAYTDEAIGADEIVKRYKVVEGRGRNKAKI
jgi:Kae1-associated kinase Bud32